MIKWKPIAGWPRHEVSNTGEVRIIVAGLRSSLPPHTVKPWLAKCGYFMASLYDGGRREKFYVHRLVCAAFHGKQPTQKHEVGHRDGNRLNNAASNLRWVTRAQNVGDAMKHRTYAHGSRHGLATIDEETASEIKRRLSMGQTMKSISVDTGASVGTIYHIKTGGTWRHVS